jgi:hypothetical protein
MKRAVGMKASRSGTEQDVGTQVEMCSWDEGF